MQRSPEPPAFACCTDCGAEHASPHQVGRCMRCLQATTILRERVRAAIQLAPRPLGGIAIYLHGRAWGVQSGLLYTIRPTSQAVIDVVCAIMHTRHAGMDPLMWDERDPDVWEWETEQ